MQLKAKLAILFVISISLVLSGCSQAPKDTNQQAILTDCENLPASPYPERDKDICYSNLAKANNDETICDKIQDEMDKDACYYAIADSKNDPSICEKRLSREAIDTCYMQLAEKQKNPALCEKAQTVKSMSDYNLNLATDCYADVAVAIKDPSLCEKVSLQDQKDLCYYFYSQNARDEKNCENIAAISGSISQDSCYYALASIKRDSSLCDKIVSHDTKSNCEKYSK